MLLDEPIVRFIIVALSLENDVSTVWCLSDVSKKLCELMSEKSFTHSLTQSVTHSITYSFAHLLTHSLSYSNTHTLTRISTLAHSPTHSFTHSLTRSLTPILSDSSYPRPSTPSHFIELGSVVAILTIPQLLPFYCHIPSLLLSVVEARARLNMIFTFMERFVFLRLNNLRITEV